MAICGGSSKRPQPQLTVVSLRKQLHLEAVSESDGFQY